MAVLAALLLLTHAVAIARLFLLGEIPQQLAVHAFGLLAYAAVGLYASTVLFRRRLLK